MKEHYQKVDRTKATSELLTLMSDPKLTGKKPLIICIGTDRSSGDCLGPYVGHRLGQLGINCRVLGTVKDPVHATNIQSAIADVRSDEFVIAIDACLGRMNNIGYVEIEKGHVAPGIAVGNSLPTVGDIAITGVVNVGGFLDTMVLNSTRFFIVMELGECIAHIVRDAVNLFTASIGKTAPTLAKRKKTMSA